MKKSIFLFLCFILMIGHSAFTAPYAIDSISYLKIAELEYKDGQLFLIQQVKGIDNEEYKDTGEKHRRALSSKEKNRFLRLVAKLKLLDIRSNESKKRDGYEFPFAIQYAVNDQPEEILAYQSGMSVSEKASFDSYLSEIRKIVHPRENVKSLLASFPDGQYQVLDWKRYEFRIGPKEWTSWEKNGDMVKQINVPLIVLDGKVIDFESFVAMNPKKIKSVSVFKDSEGAASIYGEQAKNGVLVVGTKKK